jgi:hypothetical protein
MPNGGGMGVGRNISKNRHAGVASTRCAAVPRRSCACLFGFWSITRTGIGWQRTAKFSPADGFPPRSVATDALRSSRTRGFGFRRRPPGRDERARCGGLEPSAGLLPATAAGTMLGGHAGGPNAARPEFRPSTRTFLGFRDGIGKVDGRPPNRGRRREAASRRRLKICTDQAARPQTADNLLAPPALTARQVPALPPA